MRRGPTTTTTTTPPLTAPSSESLSPPPCPYGGACPIKITSTFHTQIARIVPSLSPFPPPPSSETETERDHEISNHGRLPCPRPASPQGHHLPLRCRRDVDQGEERMCFSCPAGAPPPHRRRYEAELRGTVDSREFPASTGATNVQLNLGHPRKEKEMTMESLRGQRD